jgi:hypothetical protein
MQKYYSLLFSTGYLRTKLWMGVLSRGTKEVLCRMQHGNKRPKFCVTQWFLLQNNVKTRTAQVLNVSTNRYQWETCITCTLHSTPYLLWLSIFSS